MDKETTLNADLQSTAPELPKLDSDSKAKPTTHVAPPNWHNLLQGVAKATKALLTNSDSLRNSFASGKTAINQALAILGQATAAHRVYVCEYHPHPVTGVAFSCRFEWVQSGIIPQQNNPLLHNLSQSEFDLEAWHQRLTAGYSCSAIASTLSQPQQQFLESLQVKSILLVPIPVESQIWGFIGFSDCYNEREWSQDEEAALTTMAVTLGSILAYRQMSTDHQQALEQLKVIAKRDRLLRGMAQRIRTSLNLQTILDTTVAEVREFLQADRVFIINTNIRGSDSGVIAESVAANFRSMREWTNTLETHAKAIQFYFTDKRIDVIDDTTKIDVPTDIAQDFIDFQIQAIISVPIMVADQFYGLLVAHQCSQAREWKKSEIDLLDKLSTPVAIAIQQAKLYEELQRLNASLEQQVDQRTQELRQKYAELEELQNIKDEFLQAFSHDLRTPIMGILLVMKNYYSRSNGEPATISLPTLERVIQSCDRQLQLIDSLLEAHSSDVKGLKIQQWPLSLHSLSQAIVKDLEPLLAKNQATITNQIGVNLPLVAADPLHLRRVFENLIANALNHNPPGLSLILNAVVEDGMVCCTIADNGVGIHPDLSERLFDRYIRGSRSRSSGIGLGLYLCRQIITAHGGKIGVISEPGAGAKFWFTLPVANPSADSDQF